MNYCRLITLIIAMFATNAHALQYKVEIVEQFDNIRVVAFVKSDDIKRSPTWNPSVDPLPLRVEDAIRAVREFSKEPDSLGALREIELRTIKNFPGHWHYLIKLVANDASRQKYGVYVVLMNGKVIPAVIEPEAIK